MSFKPDDPRRRARRHKTELPSDLGEVVDLSKTGMRVACKGKPAIKAGVVRKIKLRTTHGSITVTGRAVWVKRTGFRKHEVGIDFVQIKPKLAAALASIAEFGFIGAGHGNSGAAPASPFGGRSPVGGGGSSSASGSKDTSEEPSVIVHAAIEMPDYYEVLGVGPDASPQDVHAAFRMLARKYHPDTTDESDGESKFIEVSEAYDVLKHPDKRRAYDKLVSRKSKAA